MVSVSMKKQITTAKKNITRKMKNLNRAVQKDHPSTFSSFLLIGAAVYLCLYDYDPSKIVQEPVFNTVKLSQCGPFKLQGRKAASRATSSVELDLEDLEIAHAHLGFAASELVALSRNLEKIWKNGLAKRAEEAKREIVSPSPCANFSLPSFSTFQNLTLPHMPEPNLTNFTRQDLNLSALGNTISNSFNATKVFEKLLSTANNLTNATVNFTNDVTDCAKTKVTAFGKNVSKHAEVVYEDIFKTEAKNALGAEWEKRMGGPKGGALRFSVNDAVQQMAGIFSTCHTPSSTSNELIARRFSTSTFADVGPAKTIMTTTVADGFLLEARTVAGLWTNVKLSRGDFEMSLRRDKVGVVHAFANGMEMGEI